MRPPRGRAPDVSRYPPALAPTPAPTDAAITARIRNLNCGLIEAGRAADFFFMDRAQHTAGKTLLESVQLGDIPGIGMVMIDGLVRCGRSRNTPPATEVPVVL